MVTTSGTCPTTTINQTSAEQELFNFTRHWRVDVIDLDVTPVCHKNAPAVRIADSAATLESDPVERDHGPAADPEQAAFGHGEAIRN